VIRGGELLRGRSRREVAARREQVEADFGERPAVDLGDPDLQQHLLALAAARQFQHVDQLGFRRRRPDDFRDPEADFVRAHLAVQDYGVVVGRDVNVFTWKQQMELLFERQRALIDDHVVLVTATGAPDDKLTVPGPLPSISTSRGWTTTASATAGSVTAMRVTSKSV